VVLALFTGFIPTCGSLWNKGHCDEEQDYDGLFAELRRRDFFKNKVPSCSPCEQLHLETPREGRAPAGAATFLSLTDRCGGAIPEKRWFRMPAPTPLAPNHEKLSEQLASSLE